MRFFFLLMVLVILGNAQAKPITIHGTAHGFINKFVYVHQLKDYVSHSYQTLGSDKISEKGNFTIEVDVDNITEVFVEITDKSGILYLDPEVSDYYIHFPDPKHKDHYSGKNARLIIDSLDTEDINSLILDYETQLNKFLHLGDSVWTLAKLVLAPDSKAILDSFKLVCKKRYKDVQEPYFHTYVQYSLATFEQFTGGMELMEMNKGIVYNSYVRKKPIHWTNSSYMNFIQSFYGRPFRNIGRANFYAADEIINNLGDFHQLKKLLLEDYYLKDEGICELVLIQGILEEYHSGIYNKTHLIAILDTAAVHCQFEENRKIAKNVKHLLTRLEEGYRAPNFELVTVQGDTITLDSLKGKYIYLDFFHTESIPAVKEKSLIPALKEKYGEWVEFVSISLDEDAKALKEYLGQNPEYDWHIANYNGNVNLLDLYNIRSLPSYFLIDQDGKMMSADPPRPSPMSPGATYTTIERTFALIKKRLEKKKEFTVGIR